MISVKIENKTEKVDSESKMVTQISQAENSTVGIVFMQFSSVIQFKIRDRNEWHLNELFIATESQQNGPYIEGT